MPLLVRLPTLIPEAHPEFLNVLDRKKTAVQRALRRGGLAEYEPEFLPAMLALWEGAGDSFVFYDIGAHIGLYSALAAKLFGASCHAFEPTPDTFRDCRSLMRDNRLSYVLTKAAVSNRPDGEIDLYISPKAETSNSLNGAFRPGSKPVKTKMLSLDSYTANGAPDPAIVKIDVETHEPEVIRGGLETIERARPVLACEFLPNTNVAELVGSLMALKRMRYTFLQMGSETPWDAKGIEEIGASLHETDCNWLLVPEELPESFYDRCVAWKVALKQCGADTNMLLPGAQGQAPQPA